MYTVSLCVFFFNDTATTEIYTLSLHDALPISRCRQSSSPETARCWLPWHLPWTDPFVFATSWAVSPRLSGASGRGGWGPDRKSTRLNSSHANISYAVFCLKKKKHNSHTPYRRA